MERKVCFISDADSWAGGWTSIPRPTHLAGSRWGKSFYRQKVSGGGGLHAKIAQSSLTVIFKLVIGGLTSLIFVVLDTVNLQFQGFPHSSVGKKSACNAGDLGSIPGSGRPPGEGNGNPLQYSCLENPMDRLQSMGSQESDTT